MAKSASRNEDAKPKSEWRTTVEWRRDQRRFETPAAPLATLPAAQRRQGLMWLVGDGMMVGWRHAPPLTPGLRDLLRAGLARLSRQHRTATVDMSGRNALVLTDKGRAALSADPPDTKVQAWIVAALAAKALP
jgi:hypothetical protein